MHLFGYVSAPSRGSRRPRTAFSLVQLLLAVAVTSLTAAAVTPVLVTSAEKARQATCLSNERQIGLGLLQYAQDNDGTLMMARDKSAGHGPSPLWMDRVLPYVKTGAVFTCPDASPADQTAQYRVFAKRAKGRRFGTYGLNGAYYQGSGVAGVNATGAVNLYKGTPLSRIALPDSTVLATEMRTGAPYSGPSENATIDWANASLNPVLNASMDTPTLAPTGTTDPVVLLRHSGGANVVWCDGHAAWMAGPLLAATHDVKGTPIAYLWTIEED